MGGDLSTYFDESEKPEGAREIECRVAAVAAKIQAFNSLDALRKEVWVKPTLGAIHSFALNFSGPLDAIPCDFLKKFPYDYRLFQAAIGDVEFPNISPGLRSGGVFSDIERNPLSLGQLITRTFKSGYRPTSLWLNLRELGVITDDDTIADWADATGLRDYPLVLQGVRRQAIGFDKTCTPYALFDLMLQERASEDFITLIEEEVEIVLATCDLAASQKISWEDYWDSLIAEK